MTVVADLDLRRRFFAEEIAAVSALTRLIEALATVRREDFLRPGPWFVQSEFSPGRWTPDDDPRHV